MNHVKLAYFCGGSRIRKDFLLKLKWQKSIYQLQPSEGAFMIF